MLIKDNHADVSLKEILTLVLAHGLPLQYISPDQCSATSHPEDESKCYISTSRYAQEQLRKIQEKYKHRSQQPKGIGITQWSDDFEANQKKTSVWTLTITITPLSAHLNTSTVYTYCIALGLKGQSHDTINRMFLQEMVELYQLNSYYSVDTE